MKKFMVILIGLVSLAGFSQRAVMTVDKPAIVIGEQTILRILFEYQDKDDDALVGWPQYENILHDKVEIIDKTVDYESIIDSTTQTYRREQQLTITAFEPDTFKIPGQRIELNDTFFTTNELQFLVNTVPVDTSKGIVDIKPIYTVEYTFTEQLSDWFKDYWPWLAAGGLAIALFLLFRLWKNRRPEEAIPEPPKIPAHITALTALNDLLNNERWKQEDKKDYYSRLTDIVRLYLEERFDIFALEQSTREIIADLKGADISENDKQYLRKILNKADMVKFAKYNPVDEDGLVSLSQSIEFVQRTTKEEGEEAEGRNNE